MAVKFLLYSRWWQQLGEVGGVEKATHRQQINGEDSLELVTPQVLTKGDRVLWRDGERWREHVVSEQGHLHHGGQTDTYTLNSSMMEDLLLAHIQLVVMKQVTALEALTLVLGQTTWEVGVVDDFGKADLTLNKTDGYKALLEIAGTVGCEIESVIEVGPWGVEHRRINLLRRVGADKGVRFEYGRDLEGVEKTVFDDEVYTAVYGYGKALESKTDGVTDSLTFASINNGVPYVEDTDAMQRWGLPDGSGGIMHAFGYYENTECEDKQQLLDETTLFLKQHCVPNVGYETNIPFASLKGVQIGDTVQVIDREFVPELRLEARIGGFERDLVTGETASATFGTVTSVLPDILARTFAQTQSAVASAAAVITASNQAVETATETLVTISKEVTTQAVTTKTIHLSDGDAAGTLSVKPDGLYYNDKKLAVETS